MVYGVDPGNNEIDHINRQRDDNRLSNLRLVTPRQNNFNKGARGFYKTASGKYQAKIKLAGQRVLLGLYDCPLMARMAYEDAKKTLHKI
jgi:hypothetical protein